MCDRCREIAPQKAAVDVSDNRGERTFMTRFEFELCDRCLELFTKFVENFTKFTHPGALRTAGPA